MNFYQNNQSFKYFGRDNVLYNVIIPKNKFEIKNYDEEKSKDINIPYNTELLIINLKNTPILSVLFDFLPENISIIHFRSNDGFSNLKKIIKSKISNLPKSIKLIVIESNDNYLKNHLFNI